MDSIQLDYDSDVKNKKKKLKEHSAHILATYAYILDTLQKPVREIIQNWYDAILAECSTPVLTYTEVPGTNGKSRVRIYVFTNHSSKELGTLTIAESTPDHPVRDVKGNVRRGPVTLLATNIISLGPKMKLSSLYILGSTTKQSTSSIQAGHFGEGLKVAALNALRGGVSMTYLIRDKKCVFGKGKLANDDEDHLFVYTTKRNSTTKGVTALLEGLQEDAFRENDYIFLLQPTSLLLRDTYTLNTEINKDGVVVSKTSILFGVAGRIYVKGFWVRNKPNFPFSINTSCVGVGRDRDNVADDHKLNQLVLDVCQDLFLNGKSLPKYEEYLSICYAFLKTWNIHESLAIGRKELGDFLLREFEKREGQNMLPYNGIEAERCSIKWTLNRKPIYANRFFCQLVYFSVFNGVSYRNIVEHAESDLFARPIVAISPRYITFFDKLTKAINKCQSAKVVSISLRECTNFNGSARLVVAGNVLVINNQLLDTNNQLPLDVAADILIAQGVFDLLCSNGEASIFFSSMWCIKPNPLPILPQAPPVPTPPTSKPIPTPISREEADISNPQRHAKRLIREKFLDPLEEIEDVEFVIDVRKGVKQTVTVEHWNKVAEQAGYASFVILKRRKV